MRTRRGTILVVAGLLCGCFISDGIAVGDEPVVDWEKIFGGTANDVCYSIQQTTDGGYIVSGDTSSYGAGNDDVYLVKINSSGNVNWQRTFGGADSESGRQVQQTLDGGYIVVGTTRSYGAGDCDVYLVKADSSGNMQWQRTFGGIGYDQGYSVQQTLDGGYIVTGDTFSYGAGSHDVYLVKTNSSGNVQWQRTFGGADSDSGWSIQQTFDGGYIVSGITKSYGAGGWDVYLVKTDSSGSLLWQRTFGEVANDFSWSVQQTIDGGYIVAGDTSSYGAGKADLYLVKTDSFGNMQWQRTFGGTDYDWGYSVQQTLDDGYIVAGETSSYGAGYRDFYLVKTDSFGNLQWQRTFGGADYDWGNCVQQTHDGGYIVGGWTGSYGAYDVYLVKLGSQEPTKMQVSIDIKPSGCPNPLNIKDKGLLSVAICGSEDFDVSTIDTASICLEGVAPIRSSYEDVATPMPDVAELCECTTAGPDGQLDLTLKFNVQDIVAAMGQVNDGDELELTLTGALDEAFGGASIEGTDCVVIISKDAK